MRFWSPGIISPDAEPVGLEAEFMPLPLGESPSSFEMATDDTSIAGWLAEAASDAVVASLLGWSKGESARVGLGVGEPVER